MFELRTPRPPVRYDPLKPNKVSSIAISAKNFGLVVPLRTKFGKYTCRLLLHVPASLQSGDTSTLYDWHLGAALAESGMQGKAGPKVRSVRPACAPVVESKSTEYNFTVTDALGAPVSVTVNWFGNGVFCPGGMLNTAVLRRLSRRIH